MKFPENFLQVPCDLSLYMRLCKKANNKKCCISTFAADRRKVIDLIFILNWKLLFKSLIEHAEWSFQLTILSTSWEPYLHVHFCVYHYSHILMILFIHSTKNQFIFLYLVILPIKYVGSVPYKNRVSRESGNATFLFFCLIHFVHCTHVQVVSRFINMPSKSLWQSVTPTRQLDG